MRRGSKVMERCVWTGRIGESEPLTSQEIYEALTTYGSLHAWAAATGSDKHTLSICIASFRRHHRPNTVYELAHDLRRARVSGRVLCALFPKVDLKVREWAPRVTLKEIKADEAHIKQWGYV